MAAPRIIVAMDFHDQADALTLARQLDPANCRLKVGKELFTRAGPALVAQFHALGFSVFLDLKFHDIPNTTAQAVAAAADLGVWMVNVHASGGRRMMAACREILDSRTGPVPLLIGVTLLTSMEAADLIELGLHCTPAAQVARLAKLAQASGLDGVVCSAQEAAMLKRLTADADRPFCLVTPGIRPQDAATDDQRRIMTPAEAICQGSDYLVIGRPITRAPDPRLALEQILAGLAV